MKHAFSSFLRKAVLGIGAVVISSALVWNLGVNATKAARAAGPCIVTIFGQQYDVAPLQTGHPGGNIFTCGTDMTAVYQSQHGTDVSQMTAYIVSASSSSSSIPSSSSSVSSVPTGSSSSSSSSSVSSSSSSVSSVPTGSSSSSSSSSISNGSSSSSSVSCSKENEDEHENDRKDDNDKVRENKRHSRERNNLTREQDKNHGDSRNEEHDD